MAKNHYLIIGDGRLAQHLMLYCRYLDLTVQQWSRRFNQISELEQLLKESTHCLLAISDSAIHEFHQEYLAKQEKLCCVHFSGALTHREIHSAHPLMTFTEVEYPLEFYKQIHFVVSGVESLQELIPDFPNKSTQLFSAYKAQYHTACVIGGNFTTLMLTHFVQQMQSLHIPESAARLYINQIVENAFQNPEKALTGPLARKDWRTIELNLKSLQGKPFEKIYETIVENTIGEKP